MPWNPDRYQLFKSERSAPFDDLLRLVEIRPEMQVIDLGCGTGELTRRLADSLPGSQVLGVDSSAEMLAKTAAFTRPGLTFRLQSIESVTGEWDLIFSNAAIQWVEDHPRLIPHLLALLRPAGQVAVQIPSNQAHPTHTLIAEIAAEQPFQSALGGWTRHSPVLSIESYACLLHEHGGNDLQVFEKVYPHVLENAGAWPTGLQVLRWYPISSAWVPT
jgi:trans-aconitate 2-methyltransferase